MILVLLIALISGCSQESAGNAILEVQESLFYEVSPEGLNPSGDTEEIFEEVPEYTNENTPVVLWHPVEGGRLGGDFYMVGYPFGLKLHGIPLNTILQYIYRGEWILGDVIGDGYVWGQDNPNDVGDVVLIISEDRVIYYQRRVGNEIVISDPNFVFFFQDVWQYWQTNIPVFESLGFHNPYVVLMFIFDGDDLRLGPFYLRDWDSMVFSDGAWHELIRKN